jgi:Protein of unknown function (DUF2480)
MMNETFVNKVAESGLVEIDLAQYYPKAEVLVFDLKDYLFKELILKEKDFREALKQKELPVRQMPLFRFGPICWWPATCNRWQKNC